MTKMDAQFQKNQCTLVRGVALTCSYLYTCIVFELRKGLNLKCKKKKKKKKKNEKNYLRIVRKAHAYLQNIS